MSVEAAVAPVTLHRPLPPEEAARGDFYALIARLLHSPPDAPLLRNLAAAPQFPEDGERQLARAWQSLAEASGGADANAVAEEYENVFVAVGKAPVSIYAGFYSGAPAVDHPRVRIQADLAQLGLARHATATGPEDHFAVIFDTMRVLVAGGAGREPATLADQKRFFERHLQPSAGAFFAAVGAEPLANYYRRVAALGAAFIALETASFQLD